MISQIPGGSESLDQLVWDRSRRFVAQVTVYAQSLGMALAHTSYDTGESNERDALKGLLSSLEQQGVCSRPMPCTSPGLFAAVSGAGGRHAPDRQVEPEDPLPADRLPVPGTAAHPFCCTRSRKTPRPLYARGAISQGATKARQRDLAGLRLDR